MSGLQIRNSAGAITIDSDYRHTIVTSQYSPPLIDVGAIAGATPFGNISQLGALSPAYYPMSGQLYWVRLNAGAWCIPGAWYFQPGTFQFVTTSRTTPLQSGVLDVMDGGGNLVWNAISAQNMPRVLNMVKIDSAPDNTVFSVNTTYSPWFLMGACPGNVDYDGLTTSFSGLAIRWTGTQFQYSWIRQNQNTFASTFGGRGGIRIPLAIFTGR